MLDSRRKRLPMKHLSQSAVYVSLGGNLIVAFAKFGAAANMGSRSRSHPRCAWRWRLRP
jgi:hypothetical protein